MIDLAAPPANPRRSDWLQMTPSARDIYRFLNSSIDFISSSEIYFPSKLNLLPLIRSCLSACFFFFGHLLGDKGPFQRKRLVVHLNEDALFTAEVGQTCARCVLTNSASVWAKRAGGRRPGARFLPPNCWKQNTQIQCGYYYRFLSCSILVPLICNFFNLIRPKENIILI